MFGLSANGALYPIKAIAFIAFIAFIALIRVHLRILFKQQLKLILNIRNPVLPISHSSLRVLILLHLTIDLTSLVQK